MSTPTGNATDLATDTTTLHIEAGRRERLLRGELAAERERSERACLCSAHELQMLGCVCKSSGDEDARAGERAPDALVAAVVCARAALAVT